MKFQKNIYLIIFLLLITFIGGCSDKFDLTGIDTGDGNVNIGGDTLYIQINPVWEGFNQPQDVIVGREPFIYVADTDNNRIVLMNLNGDILGTRSVKRPVALAQDYYLNLIVCAEFDTLGITYSAVYKYDLVSVDHQIEIAPSKRILPRLSDFAQPQREYTGAAVFYDNKYYISRRGPNNTNLIDPDNSVLIFVQKKLSDGNTTDSLVGRVALLDPLGTGIMSANRISSLTSYNERNYNIVTTLIGENSFKVQPLEYFSSPEYTGYVIAILPQASDLMTAGFFSQPEDAAIDNSGNIYVADAAKDSIYKFNSFGDLLISFGGEDQFNNPFSVAFFDKTLYVADTGNNRIVRFILSTDVQ
jgi:DNA-binding beta-propeller fold protein YncE